LENADTEPRPGEASPEEKETAAFMKMQLERKLCAGQEKARRSLMKARKGAWPGCLLSAPEHEVVGAKGY
jgi:hypothetical protein